MNFLARFVQLGDRGYEVVRPHRQDAQHGRDFGGDSDELVHVVVERLACGADRVVGSGEQRRQLSARFGKVRIGPTAWWSASRRSGAVACSPRVASSSADTVDGPLSLLTIELSWSIMRFSCVPLFSRAARRWSVAAVDVQPRCPPICRRDHGRLRRAGRAAC